MNRSATVVSIHLGMLLGGVLLAAAFQFYPAELGRLSLEFRFILVAFSTLLILLAMRPWLPFFADRPGVYLPLICLPALVSVAWYFLLYLPADSDSGLEGEQLASSLITDSSVNGIVVVGFAYPIFTPTIRLGNNGLQTREVDVYLRILDGNNEPALFRAVRESLPDARLSVEATVRGMLSDNESYHFLPIEIPPRRSVEGQVVFIISDLNDGTTFDEALGRSYPAEFQIRDPESGEMLLSFALTRSS